MKREGVLRGGAGLLICVCVAALVDSIEPADGSRQERFHTSRSSSVDLPLPEEDDAFVFAVFGDRTGGPPEGIEILRDAVAEVNLIEPDLVMTVGDLIQGYNETPEWLEQATEFKEVMGGLACPWFPVAGNHDVYWRGEGEKPAGEHEANYEAHFGPLWYAFRHKTAWFVVLYSDEGDPETGVKSFGDPAGQRVSPEQFAWLETTLERTRGTEHVFVFLHHPRWIGDNYGDDWDRVHALLAAAGNVDAVFAGHIHRMRYDGPRDGIEYFTLATVGGGQSELSPEAGYLHEYHLVTVRDDHLAVTTYPVGSGMDPRSVTGEISDAVRTLANTLGPTFEAVPSVRDDLSAEGLFQVEISNPVEAPIELTLMPQSEDPFWSFTPEHQHTVIEPGATYALTIQAIRPSEAGAARFELPELALSAAYLTDDARYSVPARLVPMPLDTSTFSLPGQPPVESVLLLDGEGSYLQVEHAALNLPDGPFTVEGWLRATEYRDRQGFVNKTEGSEFGIFVSEGKPEFFLHVDGAYTKAGPNAPILVAGAWHHLAGVFDGEMIRLYLDGRLVDQREASGARTINTLPLLVGADVGSGGSAGSFFPGEIDEIRISRTARYTLGAFTPARRFEPDEDTALLLHMDGRTARWTFDSSPSAAHPTCRGGTRIGPSED